MLTLEDATMAEAGEKASHFFDLFLILRRIRKQKRVLQQKEKFNTLLFIQQEF